MCSSSAGGTAHDLNPKTRAAAGPGGQLINQRFLPRITEGEVRVLMIFDRPVHVVHKKPGKKGLSATLFSGAKCAAPRFRAPG